MTITSYHGSAGLKAHTLEQLAEHRRLDEIVQGQYWTGHKGCAVGCLTHDPTGGHAKFPELWGVPVELAYLIDQLFELLPSAEAVRWPERAMSAVPVGADLGGVWARWGLWMLVDETHGVLQRARASTDATAAVEGVAALFTRCIGGDLSLIHI